MTIDRRTFMVQGATLLATTGYVGILVQGSPIGQSQRVVGSETNEKSARFKIDGWEICEAGVANANDVWLTVNRSWRAAWR
jgi:hypothetical protein